MVGYTKAKGPRRMSKFKPQEHLIKLQGKDYLEVKYRIQWFRSDHPTGSIITELLDYKDGIAVVQATISVSLEDNHTLKRTLATGLAIANSNGKKVNWVGKEIMKAETAAIGRALAHAGYGTQFTGDEEGDFLADSPVEKSKKEKPSTKDGKPSGKIDTTQDTTDTDTSWHPGFEKWCKEIMADEYSKANMLAALTNSLDLLTCHEMADYPGGKTRAMLAVISWMIGYDSDLVDKAIAEYFPKAKPDNIAEYKDILILNNTRYAIE
jgi:hypothetical protein